VPANPINERRPHTSRGVLPVESYAATVAVRLLALSRTRRRLCISTLYERTATAHIWERSNLKQYQAGLNLGFTLVSGSQPPIFRKLCTDAHGTNTISNSSWFSRACKSAPKAKMWRLPNGNSDSKSVSVSLTISEKIRVYLQALLPTFALEICTLATSKDFRRSSDSHL